MNRRHVLVSIFGFLAILIAGLGSISHASDETLAIKGYDPVAYFTQSKPMKGDPKFAYSFDGSTYYFASSHHLELFKSDPDKYAPVYRSFCTAALAHGVRIVANPENWTIYEGRLHIFGNQTGPAMMRQDPTEMKRKADMNFQRLSELPLIKLQTGPQKQ